VGVDGIRTTRRTSRLHDNQHLAPVAMRRALQPTHCVAGVEIPSDDELIAMVD
jgi:hypothetical protein